MSRNKLTDNRKTQMGVAGIGRRILQVRKNIGLSQSTFAEKISEKRGAPAISEWENGIYTPSITVICKICTTFNIDANWLLTGEEESDQQKTTRDPNVQKLLDIAERVLTGPDQMAAETLRNSILYIGKCEEEKGDRAEGPKGDAGTIGG